MAVEHHKVQAVISSKGAVREVLKPLKAPETVKKLAIPEKLVHDVFSEWAFEQTVISYASLHEELAISALQIVLFSPFVVSENVRAENSLIHVKQGERSERMSVTKNETYDVRETVESVLVFLQKIFGDKNIASHFKEENVQAFIIDGDTTQTPIRFSVEEKTKDAESIESGILFILQSLSYLAMGSFDIVPRIGLEENIDISLYSDKVNQFAPSEKRIRQEYNRVIFGVVIWMILQGFDRSTKSGKVIDVDVSTQDQRDTREIKPNEIFFDNTMGIIVYNLVFIAVKRGGNGTSAFSFTSKKTEKSRTISVSIVRRYIFLFHDRILKDTIHLS